MSDTPKHNFGNQLDQSLMAVKQRLMNLEHGNDVTVPAFELHEADLDRSQEDFCEGSLGIQFEKLTNEPIQASMMLCEPHMAHISGFKENALDSPDVTPRNNFSLADFLVNNNLELEFNKEDEN